MFEKLDFLHSTLGGSLGFHVSHRFLPFLVGLLFFGLYSWDPYPWYRRLRFRIPVQRGVGGN